jgi:ceramide glucosyltransferase
MADSNVLIPPDYLDQLLARWQPDVGLVCSPPIGVRPEGVAAEIECAFLNTYQGRWQLTVDTFGFGMAQGKTMLWKRGDLDRAGGMPALASEPAEDAAASKIVHRAGHRIRLVRDPYPQPLGRRTVSQIWLRQLRWARLRRATFAPLYALELFSGGFLPLAGAAILVATGPATWPWLVGLFAAWYGAELLLAARMKWPVSVRLTLCMLIRDLALPALWVAGWTGHTFVWRGNAMNIKPARSLPALPRPAHATYNAIALRLRSVRVVRSFRALGAFRAVGGIRGDRQAVLPRWTWKTGNKTR